MNGLKSYILSIMMGQRKTADAYIVAAVLSIISVAYLAILKCVYFLYKSRILRSYKAGVKVISIGNITLGGTGKTPFAIALAENIKVIGRNPAVLTRGYGDDESHLLKERLDGIPVLVGKDRVKSAIEARERMGSDCLILDDGFQHHRLGRDLDIVLIDAVSPFGGGKLFPRGLLREPLSRLRDADIAVLTKSDMGRGNIAYISGVLNGLGKKIDTAFSIYQPVDLRRVFSEGTLPLAYIMNKKAALLAGIADPKYFEWLVRNLGTKVGETFYYTDHHPYSEKDMAFVIKKCLSGDVNLIITTEKDAVRLRRLKDMSGKIEILALRIHFRLSSNEKCIFDRLHSIFAS